MVHALNDWLLRVAGIIVLVAIMVGTDDAYAQPIRGIVLVRLLLGIGAIILTWHLNRSIILHFRAKQSAYLNRFGWLFVTLVSATVATTFLDWFMKLIQYDITYHTLAGFITKAPVTSLTIDRLTLRLQAFGFDWLYGLFTALFYLGLYNLIFTIRGIRQYGKRLEQAEREKEQLRMANLQSQLDVLKQQVNPHFLFNALNSLSSLISENPAQAEVFVDKLSGVYRYVLRANEQQLTTVEAELAFIDAYYHLLKTRYGAGLDLLVIVDPAYHPCQLPPLTLQLLVENAVKHNVVSPKRPLRIQIKATAAGELRVSNTLQKKQTRVLSNGVGLTNIIAKYQMLSLPSPSVLTSDDEYIVSLPLVR